MINVIIYSKDRAMQLDCLLTSLKSCMEDIVNSANVSVIYKASNEQYKDGYKKVIAKEILPNVKFIKETDFKKDTLNAIETDRKYTMFLVDDIIFYNKVSFADKQFSLFDKFPEGILGISLRLSSHTNYCYPLAREQSIPSFHKECAWNWTQCEGDYGYPMSLDGNIYHTNKILEILLRIRVDYFTHPNMLESGLNDFAQLRRHSGTMPQVILCYLDSSRLVNNPCNRVQDIVGNKTENTYSPEELNNLYLSGKSIDYAKVLETLKITAPNGAHFPFVLEFCDDSNK